MGRTTSRSMPLSRKAIIQQIVRPSSKISNFLYSIKEEKNFGIRSRPDLQDVGEERRKAVDCCLGPRSSLVPRE
jgi:hypothetical protein